MIGKILGAAIGAKVAERSSKIDSTSGTIMGLAASTFIGRVRVSSLIAVAAGAYLAKRMSNRI